MERVIQSTAEGLVLGQFESAVRKTGEPAPRPLEGAHIVVMAGGDSSALQAAADRGRVLGECANDARLLANEPSNVLTPRVFAERASALARGDRPGR